MAQDIQELAIVGGGPAGMAAALVAGRCRLAATVVNEESPRNRVTHASHGFLTRDGAHPSELLEVAKAQLRAYPTVVYETGRVLTVARQDDAFHLRLASGRELRARRVLLATGHSDELDALGLPGIHEVYGKGVFPCPFCDGFEQSGKRLAVFGAQGVERHATLLKMWSDDVAVFTNGRALDADAKAALARNGVAVHEGKVLALEANDGRLARVRLEGGSVERDAGFLWDWMSVPSTTFADDLGVRRASHPRGAPVFEADDAGRTNVPRVYVVGDLRSGFSKLLGAAADGARCVEHIVHELAQERWR